MMLNKISTCLWFDGQAHDAATFYCSIFKNSNIIAENPVVVSFELNGSKWMGLNGGPMFTINPSISFFVYCNTVDDVNKKWDQLSPGGKVMMPVDTYPWSKRYGWCQDKFGVNWQIMLDEASEEKIIPSLMFTQSNSGRAQEAIDFYCTVFKDAAMGHISRYQKGEGDTEGYIKNAQFALCNQRFSAMDSSGAHQFTFNEAVSFVVDCESQQEIDYFWYKLSEGGSEGQCGWLKDKFGLSWQIVPGVLAKLMSDPQRSQKVMQAFMQMKKFDIEKLLNA